MYKCLNVMKILNFLEMCIHAFVFDFRGNCAMLTATVCPCATNAVRGIFATHNAWKLPHLPQVPPNPTPLLLIVTTIARVTQKTRLQTASISHTTMKPSLSNVTPSVSFKNLQSPTFKFPRIFNISDYVFCVLGGCFVKDCPPTLVWDPEAYTCNYP